MHRKRNEAFHLHFSADLIPFTQEILKGKLNFLCSGVPEKLVVILLLKCGCFHGIVWYILSHKKCMGIHTNIL